MNIDLKKTTDEVRKIARKTGDIIRENINKDYTIEKKGQNDFVTQIDKECEQYIVGELEKLLPQAGFIAEENTSTKKGKEFDWIVDPIDGTTNFIHGLFPVSVSIALRYKEEIILGVIYEVGLDECFYAYKNGGAWLDGKDIKVSEKKTIQESLFAIGFPYTDFEPLTKYIQLVEYIVRNSTMPRRTGSSATELVYLACGRQDGFFEYALKPYDVAAGIIIIKEAGGKICDFSKGENYLFGEEIIAANPYIFDELKDLVYKFMKQQD